MTTLETLRDGFLSSVANNATSLVETFDAADAAASGDSGYRLNLDAAKAFGFPVDLLSAYNPNEKDNPIVGVVSQAQDIARPHSGRTFRTFLAETVLRAVNASSEDEAAKARELNPKVPARKLPENVTSETIAAELRAEADAANAPGSNIDPANALVLRRCADAIDDFEQLVALGKKINAATVDSTRWIAKAVFLPIIEPMLEEYEEATKGYGAKPVGSIWQEIARKAASAHKGTFVNDDKTPRQPTQEEVLAAIEETTRKELGLDNITEILVGKEKASDEEIIAGALKSVYNGLRTLDAKTGGVHGLIASVSPILRHVGKDVVAEERAAKDAEKDAKKKSTEATAKAERDKRLEEKRAAMVKPTATAAATGADMQRAQAEVDAADKAAKGTAAKKSGGPVLKGAKPANPAAELAALSAQVAKGASAKPAGVVVGATGKPVLVKKGK